MMKFLSVILYLVMNKINSPLHPWVNCQSSIREINPPFSFLRIVTNSCMDEIDCYFVNVGYKETHTNFFISDNMEAKEISSWDV